MASPELDLSTVLRALADWQSVPAAAIRLGTSPAGLTTFLRAQAETAGWSAATIGARMAEAAERSERAERSDRAREAPVLPEGSLEPLPIEIGSVIVYSDGAARGNPGPAGAGAVVMTTEGRIVARLGRALGEQTNNVAEYAGVILGLEQALRFRAREVTIRADSLLVIEQLRGAWKVRNEGLQALYAQTKALLRRFDRVTLEHVPREQNTEADRMSNRAIDERLTGEGPVGLKVRKAEGAGRPVAPSADRMTGRNGYGSDF